MKFIADLHIHSRFSRATSRMLTPEQLFVWAQIKGIQLVATGDCIHPGWLAELKEKLLPCGNGLFELKPAYAKKTMDQIPVSCRNQVRFILSTEISSIYKKGDKVRKIHNLFYMPNFKTADLFATALAKRGNIASDGRPILGTDSRDLLEIALGCNPDAFCIPAHVWTPWFSILGSKSGFNSIEECFGDLTKHIFALETGLSSDPLMNWRLSSLDNFVLVSNSDAHSPQKLGREANMFDTELSYTGVLGALRDEGNKGFKGTIEFFPEEGKYHYDGHSSCHMRMHPRDTIKSKGLCPVCKRRVTVGVMSRVEELADREEGKKGRRWRPYKSIIPLPEIIGDVLDVGVASKKVDAAFKSIIATCGNEFSVLLDIPIKELVKAGNEQIAEAIQKVREGKVEIKAGFDGEFGEISIPR